MKRKGYKRIAGILVLFLFISFIPAGTAEAAGGDYIRIGLKYAGTSVSQCTVSSDSGFLLGSADRDGFYEYEDLTDYTELTVSVSDGEILLSDSAETVLSDGDCLMPADYDDDGMVKIDGIGYRGGVMVRLNGSKLTVINFLTIEQYVRGVVSKEMQASSALEALKAQAVAARSFGEVNRNKHSQYGFDLCATTNCQVYGGVAAEYDSTNRAVEETAGEMIRYEGRVVEANYFANSGGHTRNSEDVWGGYTGYLRGVEDLYSPVYTWTADLTYEQVAEKLSSLGSSYSCGTVYGVSVTGRDDFGFVNEMTITGSDGTTIIKGEKCRTVFGLKSSKFTLAGDSDSSSDSYETKAVLVVKSRDGQYKSSLETISVLSASGLRKCALSDLYITDGKCLNKTPVETTETGDGNNQSAESGTGHAVFSGTGYGHGVGMAQQGAQKMAQLGFTYNEILHYYYTDIEVR
ncbi:MAG: SpoIID/LytB domain-containing protein [Firmicutes bacterium]|nr:SpoIID/LytB domain-containing protein [Bacillota bacterium]